MKESNLPQRINQETDVWSELRAGSGNRMIMQVGEKIVPFEQIRSDSEFVLVSETMELLSEHYTLQEAMCEYYQHASRQMLGDHLPVLYRREEASWMKCEQL